MIIVFKTVKDSSGFLNTMDNLYDWHLSTRIDKYKIFVNDKTDKKSTIINIAKNYCGEEKVG